ncbi:MAG TPA: Gfo/Idh/MocA family oxidoreductase [Pirellulaceae bacterium]|nr:Gfo/Idh/MocA family oxidoreductase [Pirellulaceae bacterium]
MSQEVDSTARVAADPSMAASEPLRLAMIGLGNQGLEHLRAARAAPDVRFVAGVDPWPTAHQRASDWLPPEAIFAKLSDLVDSGLRCDALVVALPHDVAASLWPELAALGKPILKEKPLARTLEEARRYRNVVGGVQTAIQRRHHPSYRAAREFLRTERLVPREIHVHMYLGRSEPVDGWRRSRAAAGGGILLDAGYHLIDLVHYLIGPFDPITCELRCGDRRSAADEIEDHALLLGRSEQAWVTIEVRRGGGSIDQGFDGSKSEGLIVATDAGILRADRVAVSWNDRLLSRHDADWTRAMAEQLSAFARQVRSGQWTEDYWDQLPAMRLIDEAYRLASRF